ncbi:MAG: hypothetical protein P8R42_07695 [Candidatus Binatia bacterium]|nr:hypothetical protein [Candidatus Binatia bacterium]
MGSPNDPRPDPAQRIVPALNCGDATAAIEFLCPPFAFEERYRHTDGDRVGVASQLCVFAADLDAHFAEARDAGAAVLEPGENHGSRQYRAVDPESHRWIFTQAEVEP